MARAKSIDLDQLARDGARALGRLGWIHPGDLPAKYERPEVFAMLLKGLAAELPAAVAGSREFMTAKAAVDRWAAAQQLADKAARLYHDPAVRAIANNDERVMLHYWNHPDEAMQVLSRHSVEFPRSYREGPLREVLETIGEFQNFHETYDSGSGFTAPAEQTPYPGSSVGSDKAREPSPLSRPPAERVPSSRKAPTTYEALVNKPNLSPAEWERLTSLAEQRHPAEDSEFDPLPDSFYGEEETTTHE